MEFVNPTSLKKVIAHVEPSLQEAGIGDRFQFPRLGYFCVDEDTTADKLIFNKTVGLRDTWAKQKPKPQQNQAKPQQKNQHKRPPIEEIKQLGKKYTNLPEEKQQIAKEKIQTLAENVSYEDLEPLFATAAKKAGTRIAAMITLGVLLKNGHEGNGKITEFIEKALDDKNDLLVAEAQQLK
jgi:glutaminyl-tRNA synthetase